MTRASDGATNEGTDHEGDSDLAMLGAGVEDVDVTDVDEVGAHRHENNVVVGHDWSELVVAISCGGEGPVAKGRRRLGLGGTCR